MKSAGLPWCDAGMPTYGRAAGLHDRSDRIAALRDPDPVAIAVRNMPSAHRMPRCGGRPTLPDVAQERYDARVRDASPISAGGGRLT